ncbi:MAG: porin [Acidobacteriota bacterium]|nr:porin [Acidobacteriota bacterium]
MPIFQNKTAFVRTTASVLFSICAAAAAQSTPASSSATDAPAKPADTTAAAPAPAPAAAPTWSVGPIDFSGVVDGYFTGNFNNPTNGTNQLYNFNLQPNQFSLNMAKVTLSHSADPIGYQLDLGFGKAFDLIHASEPSGSSGYLRNIEQAYVSWKPTKGKGFEADFGQFTTSAGAEVIETMNNWNYSRSILFAWAIPYYHTGLRTSMPLTKTFTGGVQVVNGWNNTEDNNTGKTIGLTGALTKPKYTWNLNYYTGPENAGTNVGFRNLIDTTLLLTPSGKFNMYLNYDYGQNRNAVATENPSGGTTYTKGSLGHWQGVAVAAHFQASAKSAITPRFEYFVDPQGFSTGTAQKLNEFTITYEYKWVEGLLARIEYRNDHSNVAFFQKNATGTSQNQSTLTLGMVAFFGPKR